MLLAFLVVTTKWNYASRLYLNYYSTSLCWLFCSKLPPSSSVSLNYLWDLLLSFTLPLYFCLWQIPCSEPHDSCFAGHSCPSPGRAARIGQKWSLQERTSPNPSTRPSCGGSVPPVGGRRHSLCSETGRGKGTFFLSLVQGILHSISVQKAVGTSILRKWNWTPTLRVMIWPDCHGLMVSLPKYGLLNFKQYSMCGEYSPEHQVHFPCHSLSCCTWGED